MENDKQINGYRPETAPDLERTKRFFLSEELMAKNPKPEVYSLADEFAKSKRNKNFLVYFLILFYITAIGIGVFFISALEENKSKRIEVSIAEFRQFNLMELLKEQKENEEKLLKLQQELEDLRITSRKELEKLSSHSQQKALAAANEKIKKMEEAYNLEIKARQDAIAALEKTIAAQRQRLGQKTPTDETVSVKASNITGQIPEAAIEKLKLEYEAKIEKLKADHLKAVAELKKENQIEKQELIESLTLRYNPVFSQRELTAAINAKLKGTANGNLSRYLKILADEKIYNEQDFTHLRTKIHHQKVILAGLLNIPYTNSVPPALSKLDRLSDSITADYETIWVNLAHSLQEKNDYINVINQALNYMSTTRGESGYVIDARDPGRLTVYINPIYAVKKGDIAYIFNDDMAIAKVELNPERGRITARVVTTLRADKIEPFYKILFEVR